MKVGAPTDIRGMASTLASIAQALASAHATKLEALERALELIEKLVPCDRCALLEAGPSGGLFAPRDLPAAERHRLAPRLSALLRELEEDEEGEPLPPPRDALAHLALPVLGLNQTMGLLFVERADAPFDEDALRLLSVAAAQLGAFLGTLRLREKEVERARELGITLQRLEDLDKRKDDFLAMLGHELRNPLGAIHNALFILDKREERDEWTARYHRIIDRQIGHLSRLVDDLLDASRVRLGKIVLQRKHFDLRSVAQRWIDAYGSGAAARSHEIALDLSPVPVMVDGDEVRLEQVFANLMTNALKYTPAAGKVRVAIAQQGETAVVRVRDDGVGIAPELLPRLFELFTQADESLARSEGGLGVGLSLVRSLVQMHGGTVEAHSAGLHQGSEFVVRLPALMGAREAAPAAVHAAEPSSRPLRVLVVEDNEDARETLQAMIHQWHHEVATAGDGVEGFARAVADFPDVALIDIGLPGVDGFELARRLRQRFAKERLHLIAMTGYGEPEKRRRATDSGFDAYLVKPFDPLDLRRRLAAVAAGRPEKAAR